MLTFDELLDICPFPIINLEESKSPKSGLQLKFNKTCAKHFNSGNECKKHYEKILYSATKDDIIQCPFGFSSIPFELGELKIAITSIVPYPRIGGTDESKNAKQFPETKISIDALRHTINYLKNVYGKIRDIELTALQNQSMALHEIRKLNRTVKQKAERFYDNNKSEEALTIWKTSELMSNQFEIIEVLANESLTDIIPSNEIELYRIFHKCVRIYEMQDPRLIMNAPKDYHPKAKASDKTFPIIPSVLIENALKYSIAKSKVYIDFETKGNQCLIKVVNFSKLENKLDEKVFKRNFRMDNKTDGSGNGLYVAQLVAKQHNTNIKIEAIQQPDGSTKVIFSLCVDLLEKK
jgi:hypothetical protein